MSKENARGMQDDVISREQVIEALGELATFTEDWSCHTWMYTDDVYNAIKQLPPIQPKLLQPWEVLAAQAVLPQPEIVRCKYCEYHHKRICPIERYFSLNGFCSRWKRI